MSVHGVTAQSCPEQPLVPNSSYGSNMYGQIFTPYLTGSTPCIKYTAANNHWVTIVKSINGQPQPAQYAISGYNSYAGVGSVNGSFPYSFTPALNTNDVFRFDFYNDDNPLEGVTAWDLTLINKHRSNAQLFCNPYSKIASDVNNNNSIDDNDISCLQWLLLGLYTSFSQCNPSNPVKSWRFFPLSHQYTFPNNASYLAWYNNPFAPPSNTIGTYPNYLDKIKVIMSSGTWPLERVWRTSAVAIKSGDVNFDVAQTSCSSVADNEDRSDNNTLSMNNATFFKKGDRFMIRLKATEDTPVAAWQAGLTFNSDDIRITGISSQVFPEINQNSYRISQDSIRMVWYQSDENVSELSAGKSFIDISAIAQNDIYPGDPLLTFDNGVLTTLFYDEVGNIISIRPEAEQVLVEDQAGISVYPTVFSDVLYVDTKHLGQEAITASLVGLDGSVLGTSSLTSTGTVCRYEVPTGLPSGVYVLFVEEADGATHHFRIIKK